MEVSFRRAQRGDVPALLELIHAAYREPAADGAWTTEAHLLEGPRIQRAALERLLSAPRSRVLVAEAGGAVLGCCHLAVDDDGEVELGLLAVRPDVQAQGIGKALVAHAERAARSWWGARRISMCVIAQRGDVISWYERLGYGRTQERVPFPYRPAARAKRDDLEFLVLRKALQPDRLGPEVQREFADEL